MTIERRVALNTWDTLTVPRNLVFLKYTDSKGVLTCTSPVLPPGRPRPSLCCPRAPRGRWPSRPHPPCCLGRPTSRWRTGCALCSPYSKQQTVSATNIRCCTETRGCDVTVMSHPLSAATKRFSWNYFSFYRCNYLCNQATYNIIIS